MSTTTKTLLIAGGIVLAFIIGFGWQYSRARSLDDALTRTRQRLQDTQRALALQQLESTLGAATITAQRGDYEPARRLASDFFTRLQSHIGSAPTRAAQPLNDILTKRDTAITMLSRSNAQAAGLLSTLFAQYRNALGEAAAPATADTTAAPQV